MGDEIVAEGTIAELSVMISSMGMSIGANPTGISDAYEPPFAFAGTIDRITVETRRSLDPDDEAAAEIRAALGIQ